MQKKDPKSARGRRRFFRLAVRLKGRALLERVAITCVAGGILARAMAMVAFGGPRLDLAFETGVLVGAGLIWIRRPPHS